MEVEMGSQRHVAYASCRQANVGYPNQECEGDG